MKLYQALTQVTLNTTMVDDLPEYTTQAILEKPLHFSPSELYHYIDAVLKNGSRHDENNLNFVSDPVFISENFNFNQSVFAERSQSFEERIAVARQIVADLNRHVSVNLDLKQQLFQLIFVD